jgi:hypothetical protein
MKTSLLSIFMFYLYLMVYLFLVCYHNFHQEYCYEVHKYWFFLSVESASLYTQLDCTRLNNIKDESTMKELKIQSVKIK